MSSGLGPESPTPARRKLISQLVGALGPVKRKDYIRADGGFHKEIYLVERTDKAEIRPEEQREKAENCRENL